MNSSDDDIGRMQQEAVRRVRDMQQRAKNMSERAAARVQPLPREQPSAESHEAEKTAEQPKTPAEYEMQSDPLGGFFRDKEKSIILLLMALLSDEEENSGLMLALLYLLI